MPVGASVPAVAALPSWHPGMVWGRPIAAAGPGTAAAGHPACGPVPCDNSSHRGSFGLYAHSNMGAASHHYAASISTRCMVTSAVAPRQKSSLSRGARRCLRRAATIEMDQPDGGLSEPAKSISCISTMHAASHACRADIDQLNEIRATAAASYTVLIVKKYQVGDRVQVSCEVRGRLLACEGSAYSGSREGNA